MPELTDKNFLLDTNGRISRRIFCTGCGANLHGLLRDQPCHRCGRSAEQTLNSRLILLGVDSAGTVFAERSCARCDYDLRGLHFDGRCPECAAPVAASLHTVSPEFVDLVWLREIRGGSELAVFGFTLLMVSAVMVILFAPIAGVFFVVWLVGFVPISNWFLCAAPRGESRFDTVVRTFTRWSFAFATASLPLAGAVLPKSVAPIICAVIGLVWPLGCLGLAWVTSRIAERLPEYSHGSWTDGPLLLAIFWAIAAGTGAWGVLAPSLHDDDHFGLLLISAGFCLMFAVALFARIYCIGRAALELLGNNERLADPPIESEPAPASGSSSEASAATHVHVG